MSRRRQLSEEEQALWRGFARSIKPLHTLQETVGQPVEQPAAPAPPGRRDAVPGPAAARPSAPLEPRRQLQTPTLAPLGRKLKQRVGRGREPIDARLDLHGKTQKEAYAALLRFLSRAQAEGAKITLVVTGKGTPKGSAQQEDGARSQRGVLKRQVPLWLGQPEFRPFVLAFEDAHVFHGGHGALYVRLRRARASDR